MITETSEAAFSHAKSLSPFYVSDGQRAVPDVKIGFFGKLGTSSVNRILSFQGSLFRELGLHSRILQIEDGCVEVTYSLGGKRETTRLSTSINDGLFDTLAYRYRILFVRFLRMPALDEIHFQRDSLYR